MNAFNLYNAVFDSARSEFVPPDRSGRIADVIQYADGALDLTVSADVAAKIVDARAAYECATDENGEGQNNMWHYVEKPLSEIAL